MISAKPIAVAPMMDWTDRHCRVLHRRLNPNVVLFTEMITANATIHGDRDRLLGFSPEEQPLVLQLGGSDPELLARASAIAAGYGYGEVNLNVGCPSDRVQDGRFGACLMREPMLVGECLAAMADAGLRVSLKCRLGVDDQDIETALDEVADRAVAAGVSVIWVHARKAWLAGLSPAQNREVPPLDYGRVHRLHARLHARPLDAHPLEPRPLDARLYPRPLHARLHARGNDRVLVGINGGIADMVSVQAALAAVDGVMIGRAAYQRPALLAELDGHAGAAGLAFRLGVARSMVGYADDWISRGGRLAAVAKPLLGLFHGEPGARRFRRTLSEEGHGPDATAGVLIRALDELEAALRGAAATASVAA